MKKFSIMMLLAALMIVLAACGSKSDDSSSSKDNSSNSSTTAEKPAGEEQAETVTVKHEYGEAVVPKNPEKVAVFDFGTLDTLDDLGIEVAGLPQMNVPGYLSKYEDSKYENLGGLKEPDFEKLHAMKPDVIFISGRQADSYDEFAKIAPTVFVRVDADNYMESFKKNAELIGEIFGKEDEVKSELADIDSKVKEINDETANMDKKALIVLGTEGKVSAYGPGSRFGIIHDVFGVKPSDEGIEVSTHGQNITFEYILEQNPDILYVVDRDAAIGNGASAKDSIENDLVKKTTAYKDGKIIYLNPEYWYLSGGGLKSMKEMVTEIEDSL